MLPSRYAISYYSGSPNYLIYPIRYYPSYRCILVLVAIHSVIILVVATTKCALVNATLATISLAVLAVAHANITLLDTTIVNMLLATTIVVATARYTLVDFASDYYSISYYSSNINRSLDITYYKLP